jgi:protein TonB
MKQKKSIKADLEKRKGMFFQLGLIVTMSVILIAFEWTSEPTGINDLNMFDEIEFDSEMMVTRRVEPPKEQPKPELPKVAEVLDIVDDDVVLPDVDWDTEVDRDTEIDFTQWLDDGDEFIEDDKPFVVVEEMPKFNGGDPRIEFRKYIVKNLTYPQIAIDNGIGGMVYVQFIVNERGEVVDAEILRSADPALDKESIRVVMSSPLWTPGRQRGKPAKVIYTFPISYVLR